MDQAVFLLDASGSIEFAGGSVLRCSGQRPEDVLGQPAAVTLAKGSVSTEAMMLKLETASLWVSQATNTHDQALEIRLARRPGDAGALLTLRLLNAEERASRKRLDELTALLEPVGIGLWTHDIGSDRAWHSPRAYEITGLDPSVPLDGTSLIPLLGPEGRVQLAEAITAHMSQGTPYNPIVELTRPDATAVIVQLFGNLNRDAQGRPTGWLGGITDLSGERQMKVQLEELRKQFEHIQRVEGLGLLTGGIAHDFNNLLTAMMGWISFVEDAPELAAQTREDLEQVRQAAQRGSSLTSQLLRYGRKEGAGSIAVDLYASLAEVAGFLRRPLPSGIELELLGPDPMLHAELDPGQLNQVLTNLVTNAAHAVRPPGQITLRAFERDQQACIEVRDTGVGMSQETLKRAFEPFFTTRVADKGTGLGLATCQQILRSLGGEISATSTLGQGSCFTIALPLSRDVAERVGETVIPPRGEETVILVEQAHMVRRVTQRLLLEAGYTVVAVDSADAALAALQDCAAALMVVDLYLPFVSGPLLVERACKAVPSLKVLYTTSTSAQDRHPDLPSDIEPPLLPKPYTRNALLQRVRSVLDA